MPRHSSKLAVCIFLLLAGIVVIASINPTSTNAADEPASINKRSDSTKQVATSNLNEVRDRARLLHQTIHGLLQAVHHHYYREDEGLPLPSATFEEVFKKLADDWNIELHWMAVNGKAMRVSHRPQNQFEKDAVASLIKGATEYGKLDGDVYLYVGAIRLSSSCLKCHVPSRKSLEDRIAALVIKMPINQKDSK